MRLYADAIVMLIWGLHAVLLFHARGVVSEASQHLANAPRWRLFRTGNSDGKKDVIRESARNVVYKPSSVNLLRKEPIARQPSGTAVGGRLVSSFNSVAHSTYELTRLLRRPGTVADAFHMTAEAKHSPLAVNDVSSFPKDSTHAISVHYKTASATSQGPGDQHAISEAATLSEYHQRQPRQPRIGSVDKVQGLVLPGVPGKLIRAARSRGLPSAARQLIGHKLSSSKSRADGSRDAMHHEQGSTAEGAVLPSGGSKTGERTVQLLESAGHQAKLQSDESRRLSHTELLDSEAIRPPLHFEIY